MRKTKPSMIHRAHQVNRASSAQGQLLATKLAFPMQTSDLSLHPPHSPASVLLTVRRHTGPEQTLLLLFPATQYFKVDRLSCADVSHSFHDSWVRTSPYTDRPPDWLIAPALSSQGCRHMYTFRVLGAWHGAGFLKVDGCCVVLIYFRTLQQRS